MEYLEVGLCFVIGFAVMLLLAFSLRVKKKGVWLLVINSLAGGGVFAILSISKIIFLPFSPLSMAICGVLGLPGVAVIIIFTLFL